LLSVSATPSIPAITLSIAASISDIVVHSFLLRAVNIADSFKRLAKSAPEKPGVRLAIISKETSGDL
jgi:hypothetical protein